ncbi:MAG TPA: XRE family transcriptional regulator, partial [Gemmatimonadaceae bacterium]
RVIANRVTCRRPMRPDPIPELKQAAGAALARRIAGWSSAHDVAAYLCTDHARILDIRRGALKRFSLEMLLRLLVRAGARVEIRVTAPRHAEPRVALIDEER